MDDSDRDFRRIIQLPIVVLSINLGVTAIFEARRRGSG
jgi:hypothetical protein